MTAELPDLIALGGYCGAGKDSVAKILVEKYGYHRIAFADALRKVLLEMNPLIPTAEGAVNLAHIIGDVGWDVAKRQNPEVRRLMEELGEGIRYHVDSEAWVTAAMSAARFHHRVVITDLRHGAEFDALADYWDAMTVWIERPDTAPLSDHPSQTSLIAADFGHVLHNKGSLTDLGAEVGSLLHDLFGVEAA
ncbi:hypothetical protein ACFWAP_00365 [Streptomyces goshikiensis]|uniref:deoxynucleotide monophosphate kinase family protein n=1 Tax=Streptomyces goshikiensis TaxID=1942 RepID=UPI0036640E82